MDSFRPVQEIWGTHSVCFVATNQLLALLHDLAARVVTSSEEKAYGDLITVWFEHGRKILNYIETDIRFNAASFADSLAEQGITVDVDDLNSLIHNMKCLASSWSQSLGAHGELTFYID